MLKRIGQIAINVYDVERATAFYRDVLGMNFLFAAPPQLAFFEIGGVWLMLAPPDRKELDHPASILYFDVDDIDASFRTLTEKRVEFLDAPHLVHRDGARQLWLATFKDTEGNTFSLRQWRNA